eukprot:g21564.t1
MVNMRPGPVMYKTRINAMVLNKHVDHIKAANSRTAWEQNVPGSLTAFPTVPEPMGSPLSIEETSESEIGMTDVTAPTPLLPEEEHEFLLEDLGRK